MNLYNELVNLIINILFTNPETNEIVITQWQSQVVEFCALPILLILIGCFVGLIWKCLKIPFYFFDK